MARDPEQVRLKIVDDETGKAGEIVRLTTAAESETRSSAQSAPATRTRASGHPADFPAERLNVTLGEERRTHEPGIEALMEGTELNTLPLEESWDASPAARLPIPWGWFVLIGLGCIGAAVWSVTNVTNNREKPRAARAESLSALKKETEEIAHAEKQVDQIVTTVKAYLAADSIDKLAPLSRHTARVRPLMESWYANHPLTPDPFVSQEAFQALDFQQGSFWLVGCKTASGAHRRLIVEVLPDNQVAVDWEFEVTYQPLDWNRYLEERPSGSYDFRVQLVPDNYYSHEFADSSHWLNFNLAAPKGERSLNGYVRRDSELARQLLTLFAQNNRAPTSVIVRISIPTDLKAPRAVVIEKLLSPHWIYLTPPDA